MINWSRAASIAAAVLSVFVWSASVSAQGSSLIIRFVEQPDSITENNGVIITVFQNGVDVSMSCFTNPSSGSPVCRNSNEFASVDFTVPGAAIPTATTQVLLTEPPAGSARIVSDIFEFGRSTVADHFRVSFTSDGESSSGLTAPPCSMSVVCITESGRLQEVFQTIISGNAALTVTVSALSDIDETTSTVPEPATLLLVGSGMLVGLHVVRKRRARL